MNVELLRQVQKTMMDTGRVDMGNWIEKTSPKADKAKNNPNDHWCGTTGCIAGWAMVLSPQVKLDKFGNIKTLTGELREKVLETMTQKSWCRDATKEQIEGWIDAADAETGQVLLDLSDDEAQRLFYTENWPAKFEDAYNQAAREGSGCGMVKATVARIDHFIETGE